jgi:prepilin-type N-terminal cleavage/methylation domain-containing protein
LQRRRGFTLLEIIVATFLFSLLMTMLFEFLVPTMRASVRVSNRVSLQDAGMVVLTRMVADIESTADGGIGFFTSATHAGYLPGPGMTFREPYTLAVGINPIYRVNGVNSNAYQAWTQKIVVYVYRPGPAGNPQAGALYRKECPPGDSPWTYMAPVNFPFNPNAPSQAWGGVSPYTPTQATTTLEELARPPGSGSQPAWTETLIATNVTQFSCYTMDPSGVPQQLRPTDGGPGNDFNALTDPVYIHLQLQNTDTSTGSTAPQVYEVTRAVSKRNRNQTP